MIIFLHFSLVLVSIKKICKTLNTFFDCISKHLRVVLSTLFSVFGNVVEHGLLFLTYYMKGEIVQLQPS